MDTLLRESSLSSMMMLPTITEIQSKVHCITDLLEVITKMSMFMKVVKLTTLVMMLLPLTSWLS